MGEQLSWYLADSASLLRDWGFQFTSQARLTRWINSGRNQTAKHSGCLRALVSGAPPWGAVANPGGMTPGSFSPGTPPLSGFYAVLNTERYSFATANTILQATNAGYKSVNDVFNVAVSWASFRPVLRWFPWDDLQAYARAYSTLISSYPMAWSSFGSGTSGQVWLWPPPSQNCEMEWDCTCLPMALASDDDYDAIPDSFTSAVKFYAAGMAMLGTLRYGLAETMFRMYLGQVMESQTASDGGKIPDYYYTSLAIS